MINIWFNLISFIPRQKNPDENTYPSTAYFCKFNNKKWQNSPKIIKINVSCLTVTSERSSLGLVEMLEYQLFYTCHNWSSTRKSESPIFSYQFNLISSFAFFHRKWNQYDVESRCYLFISIYYFSLNYFMRIISTVCYYSSDLITISVIYL